MVDVEPCMLYHTSPGEPGAEVSREKEPMRQREDLPTECTQGNQPVRGPTRIFACTSSAFRRLTAKPPVIVYFLLVYNLFTSVFCQIAILEGMHIQGNPGSIENLKTLLACDNS